MGNKQEELEFSVQSHICNITGLSETWQDNSHNWTAETDGYRLFESDEKGERGGVALYIRKDLTAWRLLTEMNRPSFSV